MYDTTSHGGPTAGTSATILPLSFPFTQRPGKNFILWGSTKCWTATVSETDAAPFLGPHQTPSCLSWDAVLHMSLSQLSSANCASSKARHSYRAPPVNSEPSLSSAGSMSAAPPPCCASHRGPDPQHLIQRSGLGIQEWTFLLRCSYCCLGTYLEATGLDFSCINSWKKKKSNFETHFLMKYKPVPWSWGNTCNVWKVGVRKQRQNSAQAAHTT